MLDGLAFVWRQPVLRMLAWTSACWHLLFYGYMALYVLFATRVLGMSPGLMGTAQMLGGVGVLASSMLLKPLTQRFGAGGTIADRPVRLEHRLRADAGHPARPVRQQRPPARPPMRLVVFWLDCGATLFFLPYLALRQRVTPDALLGRMTSTMRFMTVATAPLGAAGAGAAGGAARRARRPGRGGGGRRCC